MSKQKSQSMATKVETFTRESRSNRIINFEISADHCNGDVALEYRSRWNERLASLKFSANIQLETRHK